MRVRCEDAATFIGSGPRYVRGGGAREASDKIFQHNGEGWLYIDGFYANKFGKFYRSCGNCSQQFTRHVNITNLVAIQGVISKFVLQEERRQVTNGYNSGS